MKAWGADRGIEGSFITMMGDPSRAFTDALGVTLSHPEPMSKFALPRCKRHAMFVNDGTIELFHVSERADDPAGDDDPSYSSAPAMIDAIDLLS